MTVVILITKKPSACKGDCSFVPSAPGAPGSPQTSWSNTEIWLLSYLSVLSLPPTISTLHLCNWWKIPCSTLVHFKPKSWTSIYYTLKYVRCQEGIDPDPLASASWMTKAVLATVVTVLLQGLAKLPQGAHHTLHPASSCLCTQD